MIVIMKDYYGILEVNEKASPEIIDKAYKTLVKKYHPDLYSSIEKIEADKKLQDINEAYHILSDHFLRSQYDLELQRERMRSQEKQREEIQAESTYQNENKTWNAKQLKHKKQRNKKENVKTKNHVGTVLGLADVVKALWENRPERTEKRKMNQKDWLAFGLTILALLIISTILWFIPFTNGWMRQLLFENPISNLIAGLFS